MLNHSVDEPVQVILQRGDRPAEGDGRLAQRVLVGEAVESNDAALRGSKGDLGQWNAWAARRRIKGWVGSRLWRSLRMRLSTALRRACKRGRGSAWWSWKEMVTHQNHAAAIARCAARGMEAEML